ncbi:MAG: hypothetical protein KDE33_26760 [Bacteroidetes bacterium]|nr:hypothetical protein [Bacteroidota bacterium]MCB9227349.1 hypothetical protein [Chitinophagales bacterium]
MKIQKFLATILFLIISIVSFAQNQSGFEQSLVGTNKMIAVIVVLAVILIGIAIFLFYLERKIKNIENEIKPNK